MPPLPLAVDTTLFGTVLFAVVIVATVIAAVGLISSRGLYDQIGKGGLLMDSDLQAPAGAGSSGTAAERDAEIRQMLEARNERRLRQGKAALDIDAEIERLAAPRTQFDAGLLAEIRELVVARNDRRVRQGKAPLDVDAEVERQVRELGG